MTDAELVATLRTGNVCADPCRVMEAKSGCICATAADAIERLVAECDEAEQYANKANAALMEAIARAEKAEAENQGIKAVALHGEIRLCTKAEWEARYGDKND